MKKDVSPFLGLLGTHDATKLVSKYRLHEKEQENHEIDLGKVMGFPVFFLLEICLMMDPFQEQPRMRAFFPRSSPSSCHWMLGPVGSANLLNRTGVGLSGSGFWPNLLCLGPKKGS